MDFKVNDKVECYLNGEGKVVSVDQNYKYSVKVYFKHLGVHATYTPDGRIYIEDKNPVLKKI